jgi:hypothetical protein
MDSKNDRKSTDAGLRAGRSQCHDLQGETQRKAAYIIFLFAGKAISMQ